MGLEQQAVAVERLVDRYAAIRKYVHCNGEVHAGITRIDIFEEIVGATEFRKEIGEIERPEHMALRIETGFRCGDVTVAEMWSVIEKMMEHHLGEANGMVKGIKTAVRRVCGGFQLAPGYFSHFSMAVIGPLIGQPAFFIAADTSRTEKF